MNTTISLTYKTKKRLARKGSFGQSYNDILNNILDDLEKK